MIKSILVFMQNSRFILSDFNEILIFSIDFRERKNTQLSNFAKILQWEQSCIHADGWTDRQDEDEANNRLTYKRQQTGVHLPLL
jgi:hypothetical protein